MKEERKNLIDNLNRMYCSQSKDYKEQYREEYFCLLEFIVVERDEICIVDSKTLGFIEDK